MDICKQGARFGIFYALICGLFLPILQGSEDSVEAVMEGYVSPQKLFADIPSQKDNNAKAIESANSAKSATKPTKAAIKPPDSTISPKDMKLPTMPKWIYSTAIIETLFTNGSFKKGLGTLLKNGLYITSSEVVYNGKVMPNKIYVKMLDDFSSSMICVAELGIKAVDLDAGLALLRVVNYTDSFCGLKPKTYYQDRIYKRFGIDVFAANTKIKADTKAFYPYLNNNFAFEPKDLKLSKFATYYDFDRKREQVYGFEMNRDDYEEFTYGRAFYDKKGVFLGILSRAGVGYLPVFINRSVIQDFLCLVQDSEIINDSHMRQSCQKLGKKRERFFVDMSDRTTFY